MRTRSRAQVEKVRLAGNRSRRGQEHRVTVADIASRKRRRDSYFVPPVQLLDLYLKPFPEIKSPTDPKEWAKWEGAKTTS